MKVVFRCDSSVLIGSGHTTRCLTLADEIKKDGHETIFISRKSKGNQFEEIKLRGHSVMPLKIKGFHPEENLKEIDSKPWSKKIQEEDAIKTIKTIQGEEFDWLVLDHYFLNKIWERKVKGYVNYLFVIDDFTDRKHECDVLMNHGFLSKDREVFKELVSGKTKLLLGPKYVLLRPEYSLNRSNFSKKHNVKNVVVFYGNSDLTNETLKSLEAISRLNFDDLYINVVIGSNNPFFDIIQQKVKEIRNCHLHVQLPHLANLFSQANLALCAGGGALWELMCMGVPSLVTITSENQSAAAKILSSKEAVYCLGESREVSINDLELNIRNMLYDEKKLTKISHKAKKLVNGNGAKEVIREMKHLSM